MTDHAIIYLDHMASCPLDPAVAQAMAPWLGVGATRFGNPHAQMHNLGWDAAQEVARAQGQVAALIGGLPDEIVFTAGATEANNLAICGTVRAGDHVITVATEHPAVLSCVEWLAEMGARTTVLPVDRDGRVDPAAVADAIADDTALVTVMAVNNETGIVQPIEEIAEICRARGVLFHTDATQAVGTRRIDVSAAPIDLLSISGHKIYGPQGIGALYVRNGTTLHPTIHGGGQQAGRRSGTVPVGLTVGLGTACAVALERRDDDAARMTALRERLWGHLQAGIPGAARNTPPDSCVAGCLNVSLPETDAVDLLLGIDEIAASTVSACATEHRGASHVLTAMGRGDDEIAGALRLSLGRYTTEAEIDRAGALLVEAWTTQRRGLDPKGAAALSASA